ncbi:HECT domain-containing protein [Vairimorpha necatrix]|uniref:HECT-type E3 ubiquitin transferase n=1 Tax=Vairimorpha necatrix TaxID=6039 RepID=A0AAX4JBY8_9MICR
MRSLFFILLFFLIIQILSFIIIFCFTVLYPIRRPAEYLLNVIRELRRFFGNNERQHNAIIEIENSFKSNERKFNDYISCTDVFYEDLKSRFRPYQYFSTEITVDRKDLLNTSIKKLMNLKENQLLPNIKLCIRFKDEIGADEGGLTREWISLIIDEIFDAKTNLFECTNGDLSKMIPVDKNLSTADLLYYKFLGRVLGRMIVSKVNADVRLHGIIWKFILDLPCADSDYKNIDPVFYRNLLSLKEDDVQFEDLSLTFEYDGMNLIRNGKKIYVDEENVELYIDRVLKYKYDAKINIQCQSIKEGLNEIIPRDLLNYFSPENLELLICGTQDISVEHWKKFTKYKNYKKEDLIIKWFWEIVQNFSQEKKVLLLNFVTGSRRLPAGGFRNISNSDKKTWKFTIQKCLSDDDKILPSAWTCNKILSLPVYKSKKILEEKLFKAIIECQEGFLII